MIEVLGWLLAGGLVVITVLVHYETMLAVSDRILPWAQKRFHGRRVIIVSIAALLFGHIVEIWLFALAMLAVMQVPGFGSLSGDFSGSFSDFIYFSAVNYTSLGTHDLRPEGCIRAITASETLAGLVMIAWSASFTYLKMEQIWQDNRAKENGKR